MTETEFTLFAVSDSAASDIRSAVKEVKSPYAPLVQPWPKLNSNSNVGASSFGSSSALKPLEVQNIGAYKITVAPSLTDLETRAPWEKYSIPANEVEYILKDVRNRYEKRHFGFVIAEGKSLSFGNSFQAGFGIMYRDGHPNGGFLPISHEPTPQFQSSNVNVTSTAQMDVTVIALGAIIKPLSLLGNAKHWPLRIENGPSSGFGHSINHFTQRVDAFSFTVRGPDEMLATLIDKWSTVCRIHRTLPRFGDGKLHSNAFVQPEWPSVATVWTLKGLYPNRDLFARKANGNDAAVVKTLYSDIDAWLRVRSHNTPPWSLRPFQRLDMALAMLARQLAEPGINDRFSDSPETMMGEKVECRAVNYFNLDEEDCDLDEQAYQEKDDRYRFLNLSSHRKNVDTLGHTYLRISPFEGPFESLEMRTVGSKKQTGPTAS
ncbi:hypothetical protein FGB62_6g144 [Gracilaria domingensis]|nr:hypothetical protein FGB62_6g144 [Gracilaria domingensis]